MSATKNGPARPAPANGRDREARGEQPREDRAKPVHEIRLGRIRAAVWLNDTENGPRYNVQISRLYKDKQRQVEGLAELRPGRPAARRQGGRPGDGLDVREPGRLRQVTPNRATPGSLRLLPAPPGLFYAL